jgi:hypothetical protein
VPVPPSALPPVTLWMMGVGCCAVLLVPPLLPPLPAPAAAAGCVGDATGLPSRASRPSEPGGSRGLEAGSEPAKERTLGWWGGAVSE